MQLNCGIVEDRMKHTVYYTLQKVTPCPVALPQQRLYRAGQLA